MFSCVGRNNNAVGVEPEEDDVGLPSSVFETKKVEASTLPAASEHAEDESGLLFKEAGPSSTVSEMFAAVKQGDVVKLEEILSKVGSPDEVIALLNTRGMWGSSPLMTAIQYGHSEVVHKILERDNIDTHMVNEKGASAFLYACLDGHTSVIMDLMQYKGEHRSMKKHKGIEERPAKLYNAAIDDTGLWTPLVACVASGNAELFSLLVHSDTGGIERCLNTEFRFPVTIPMQEDKLSTVKHLSPVMVICAYGHTHLLRSILENGGYTDHLNLQHKDENGASVLHHAARGRDPEGCMTLLLRQNQQLCPAALASISAKSASPGSPAAGGKLLTLSEVGSGDNMGYTPSHYLLCRKEAQPKLLGALLQEMEYARNNAALDSVTKATAMKGAVSLARYPVGSTMLHIAVARKQIDCARLLLEKGADPTISSQGPDGSRTCMELATRGVRNNRQSSSSSSSSSSSNQSSEMITLLEEAIHTFQATTKASGSGSGTGGTGGGGGDDSGTPRAMSDGSDMATMVVDDLEDMEEVEKAIDAENDRRARLELRRPERASC